MNGMTMMTGMTIFIVNISISSCKTMLYVFFVIKGINVFLLQDNGKYDSGKVYDIGLFYSGGTNIPVKTLEGLSLNIESVFPENS
jgi:hypothetical protein